MTETASTSFDRMPKAAFMSCVDERLQNSVMPLPERIELARRARAALSITSAFVQLNR